MDAPHFNERHGHAKRGKITPTFRTWIKMRERCGDQKSNRFYRYGARGITVCERWRDSFANFLEDMGERPSGKTLDRIDNSKGYFKENCRWVTKSDQARNKSSNRHYELRGETKCVAEWAREYGLDYFFVMNRLKAGWTIEEALETPRLRPHGRAK